MPNFGLVVGRNTHKGLFFNKPEEKGLSEILFPRGRGLGRGDRRDTNPFELGAFDIPISLGCNVSYIVLWKGENYALHYAVIDVSTSSVVGL
jgi:hypothetical protein